MSARLMTRMLRHGFNFHAILFRYQIHLIADGGIEQLVPGIDIGEPVGRCEYDAELTVILMLCSQDVGIR